jgi:hypothetical protein
MKFINSLFSWLIKKRLHQIELFMRYPVEVQQEWFKILVENGTDTQFGQKYNFDDINTINDFQQRVPVHTYEDLQPYIEQVRNGKQRVLWPTEVKWFAKSSGTTDAKSKFIPVSWEALEECHYKAGKDMLALYCNNYPETGLFTGKALGVGGSHSIHEVNSEEYYTGDLSAILMTNLPFWAEFIRTPDLSIALMDEWEEKIDIIARKTLNQNVASIQGVPSWSLLLLEHVLKVSGKKYIDEIWPSFEAYFHGGVSFTPYRKRFFDLFAEKKPRLMETYNASEGFFGLEDVPESGELLLMLDYGIFFEFIPMHELNKPFPKALTLDEVETGMNYAILITTNGGLWRYLIGDTIEFTSVYPFRIKITGRTKSFINLAGEELMVENADRAVYEACQKTGAIINEYTAGPLIDEINKESRHHWLVEFTAPPADLNFFSEVLDNSLKNQNSDYEAKRYRNMILSFPLVEAVPKNSFYFWLKENGKLGGQNKIPRLTNSPAFINEIKNCIKKQQQISV